MRLIGLAVILALGLLATPLAVEAQPAGKVYRVGLIFTTLPVSEVDATPGGRALLEGLRQLGYEEGRNLALERRSAEGKRERYPEIAAELVRLKTDVIVTIGTFMTQGVQEVAKATPIVMATSVSPVEAGLVKSLARPGGNVTGLTLDTGPEIEGKRLEFLKSAVPRASRVAVIAFKAEWEHPYLEYLRRGAPSLGVTLFHAEAKPNDYSEAFALMGRERPDAFFVAASAPHFVHQRVLVDFAVRSRLPAIYAFREFVEAGGLMSYGPSIPDLYRRTAIYVDKILKGAKPADLPVEQPTKFELVINLKTAKALGLTIPQTVLLQANQVIE